MKRFVLFTFLSTFIFLNVFSQQTLWQVDKPELSFVQNKGQFYNRNWKKNQKVEYAYDQKPFYILFTKTGVTYRLDKFIRNPKHKKGDNSTPKRINKSELVHINWLNTNPNVEIIPLNKTTYTHSYTYKDLQTGEFINVPLLPGYKKLLYKEIYPNIDLIYEIHPKGGVEYSFILHPNADPSQIKMEYQTAHTNSENEFINISTSINGDINIKGSIGEIIEHAPKAFESDTKKPVDVAFNFQNNVLTFDIGAYDPAKEIIIDPWVVSPTFTTSTAVWEVETDATGNVYAIGGETPMALKKYNSAGVLQWTYNTPWDTANYWLGTLATDASGNSYITSGVSPQMEKVNTAGAMQWHSNNGGGALGSSDELWSITFNCDETKLIVGGTKGPPLIGFTFYAAIYDVDVNNGNVTASYTLEETNIGGIGATPREIRSISSSENAKYIYLTHDSLGAVDDGFANCPNPQPTFQVSNQNKLGYKCEDYLPATQNGGGLKALVANNSYIYTHFGDKIVRWNLNTGAFINQVTLPGGNATTTIFGDIVVSNSGLDVDDCGNVYAGSGDRVVKFDQNLNLLSSSNTTFTVYDVSVNANGEVIAGGAQINNSGGGNRGGRIEAINMSACNQYTLVCCDANFCTAGPFCPTDPPYTFTPNNSGGTWSISPATGAFNTSTGTFDPSAAAPGTYTITYTLTCGSNSVNVTVGSCTALSGCEEANGDLTVTSGVGPYTWYEWTSTTITPSNATECTQCGGTWLGFICTVPSCTVNSWGATGTGTTYTPSTYPVKVVDANGDSLVITAPGTLAPCSTTPCDSTINPAGPFCVNDAAVTLTAVTPGGTWSGTGITNTATGTFDPASAGVGSHTISYTAPCGSTGQITIVVNALDNASFNYSGSSFCVSGTNPIPTISGTTGGTFSISSPGVLISTATGEINLSASGVGTFWVYYNTSSAGNPCPTVDSVQITITNAADASITPAGPFCANAAPVTLSAATGGGTWTGTGITNGTAGTFNPATAGPGTHQIIYTISGSCGDADTTNIVVNPTDTASFNYTNSSYCTTDPNPTANITGTTGGTFSISSPGVLANSSTGEIDIAASGTGSFTITYITSGSCPDTGTFNISINNCSLPQPVASFVASQTNLCAGDCINFTDLSTSSAGGITAWNWTFTGGTPSSSTAQNPTNICYNTPGTYDVMLTVTDANGTDDTTITGYIVVTSCTQPQPVASFVASQTNLCTGDCINFTDLSTSSAGGITAWNWTFTGGTPSSSTAQNPTNICYNTPGTYDVMLTVTDANGTDDTTITGYIVVSNCIPPTASFTVSDTSICEGDCITFTDNSSGATSWNWSFTGGTPSSSTAQNPGTVCYSSPGTYPVVLIVSNANGSDTAAASVSVFANPTVFAGNDTTIDAGNPVPLNATGAAGTFVWNPSDWLSCNPCQSPISNPLNTITYTVSVTDSNGCSAADEVTIFVEFNNVVYIPNIFSPNGDGNNDFVFVRGYGIQSLYFVIYDRWGEKVFETTDQNDGWDGTFRGKPMNKAVFVYYAKVTFYDGSEQTLKGDITLIR